LPKAIFEVEVSPQIIAQTVRVYLNNQRSAHAKVKDVGEINGTTKKMWAQKGTGRARHGSSKFGIFCRRVPAPMVLRETRIILFL